MAEKKFYLSSATKPLQEIGMRAQVVSFLMGVGVKRGNALNDSENKNRVIVAIQLENESDIQVVRDELVRHLNKLHEDKLCFGSFPSDIAASELVDLNNPHAVSVMDFNFVANSLMLEQTSKGAGAMIYMAKAHGGMATDMKGMSGDMKTMSMETKTMAGDMKTMSGDMKGMSGDMKTMSMETKTMAGDMKTMSGDMKGMSGDMKTMAKAMENLPSRLAAELSVLLKKPQSA